jgi:AcrR family transcriptional regulator
MPSRDDEILSESDSRLSKVALHVFARRDSRRQPTKDIAMEAGIGSPGLIYHYFKDIGDLLQQVIEQRVPVLQIIHVVIRFWSCHHARH